MLRSQSDSSSTNWNDLDTQGASKTEPYSKAALKKMLERRRHNDYVRKREFQMLRKIRNRSKGGQASSASMRPSFFASSMQTRTKEESAETIQKINAIEAQMSMQWWKNKHGIGSLKNAGKSRAMAPTQPVGLEPSGDAASSKDGMVFPTAEEAQALAKQRSQKQAPRAKAPVPPPPAATATDPHASTAPVPARAQSNAQSASTSPTTQKSEPVAPKVSSPTTAAAAQPDIAIDFTATDTKDLSLKERYEAKQNAQATSKAVPVASPPAVSQAPVSELPSSFSPSRLFVQEVDEVGHDPEMEEAAILFANGDDEGAEESLKALVGTPEAERHSDENAWLTLIDLYRATGQQEKYENISLDFVVQFNRSAPQWVSLPDVAIPQDKTQGADDGETPTHHWKSPSKITTTSVATLKAALGSKPQPWILNWTSISSIEDDAAEPLMQLFQEWTEQGDELHFIAARSLAMVLGAQTTVNDNSTPTIWWSLRMAHARLVDSQHDFEGIALDYCITYEVSPPSWTPTSHTYVDLDLASATPQVQIGNTVLDSITTTTSGTLENESHSNIKQLAGIELSGIILGSADEILQTIEERRGGLDVLVIACDKLIKVDFSAAGGILNWVINMHSQGVLVQFSNVHRLIASLFHVLGISEHAKVVARQD